MKFDGHISIDHPGISSFREGFFPNPDTDEKLWFYIYPCYAMATYAAYEIAKIKNFCYLVETCEHAVAFDGLDTWDIMSGFVIRNYRYPVDDFSLDKVEYLYEYIRPKKFVNMFYSDKVILSARNNHTNVAKLEYLR
jgi:hypothetical protein